MKKAVYGFIALSVFFSSTVIADNVISDAEIKRREINKKFDKMKLREKTEWVVDTSAAFIKTPPKMKVSADFTNAKVAPTIKMRILPDLVPEYFDDSPAYMTGWSHWNHMTQTEDDRFFFSVSDHKGYGCNINLYEYSHGRDILCKVLDVDRLLGWTPKSYTDGKIHGHMGIMADGTLWGATHFGVEPDSTWFANGYRGSWLFSYNINTHEAKNWGVPLIGQNLPSFSVDTRRGRLVGTGALSNGMLSWDCINKKTLFAGNPPDGWKWWRRSQLCDVETGIFWSIDTSDGKYRFMSFDPEYNKFRRYEVFPPANSYSGHIGSLRAVTDRPAMDGYYYWCTMSGEIFKFKPGVDGGDPYVEAVGVNWDEGRDVIQFAMDSTGRYLYYLPVGMDGHDQTPIVQFDIKTKKRKAISWLHDFYFEKYGYWVTNTYATGITSDDSTLVICMNGEFQGKEGSRYGHPSLFIIEIPPGERPVDH